MISDHVEDSQVALSASYASVLLWQQALAVSESQAARLGWILMDFGA